MLQIRTGAESCDDGGTDTIHARIGINLRQKLWTRFVNASARRAVRSLSRVIIGAALLAAFSTAAGATCPTFHTLTNGTTADATQVMDNFNYILNCPNFTGNVGIGTTSPTSVLTISPSAAHALIVLNRPDTSHVAGFVLQNAGTTYWEVGVDPALGSTGDFAFYNASGSTNLLIQKSTGNVGIGTASPAALLHLYGNYGTITNIAQQIESSNGNGYSGGLAFNVNPSGGGHYTAGFMAAENTNNSGATDGGKLSLWTAAQDGSHTLTRRIAIDGTGNVGIGTATPAQTLEVNGKVQVDSFATAGSASVCQNANVLSSCSSSIRYKENVKDATFGLSDIVKMRPVTFKWKGRNERDLGLIAEEVEKINPLFVTYKDQKVEGVKYAQLTAVLVSAVKQLKAANDVQAGEIGVLKSRLAGDNRRLSQLEQRLAHIENVHLARTN
ncbi:MAG: tail fiber domain-containing protein [Alphaproteobacteria bacterium]|nr:tail fiber domain-containing protein [Alphaproteobacteria bacterium]